MYKEEMWLKTEKRKKNTGERVVTLAEQIAKAVTKSGK